MTKTPKELDVYLGQRAAHGPWQLSGAPGQGYRGAIVIPSLAEGTSLQKSLASLAENPATALDRYLVVVVVNQRDDAEEAQFACNQADLAWLVQTANKTGLQLAWVDASSPGQTLPQRNGGVGLARKIGLDLALTRLDWTLPPVLVCLDADTLVEPNYLPAIQQHFADSAAGAATLPFCHQPAEDPQHQAAIDRYELFIRSYALGLAAAGSPYAFTAVGSAMACRADTYLRCGGMNRRQAGEDFYFLQQAVKTDGVATVCGTCVYPSSRVSERTPFGTGRNITQQLSHAEPLLFYPVEAFQVLSSWLSMVRQSPQAQAEQLLEQASQRSVILAEFLEDCAFTATWSRLQTNHPALPQRLRAFHGWFDGLKTLRLVHRLCDNGFPRQRPERSLHQLFSWCGLDNFGSITDQLSRIRKHQTQPALFSIVSPGILC